MTMHPVFKKMITSIARGQEGDVVDLAAAEREARIVILRSLLDWLWGTIATNIDAFDLDVAERVLRGLEDQAIIETLGLNPPTIAECRAAQPITHRAARGVRKVRGAKLDPQQNVMRATVHHTNDDERQQ